MDEVEGNMRRGPPNPKLSHTTGPQIKVGLRQAENLKTEGMADPYACISVSTQTGRRHETKVQHEMLCPIFEETCCFPVSQAWVGRVGQSQGSRTQLIALPAGPTGRAAQGHSDSTAVGLQEVFRT